MHTHTRYGPAVAGIFLPAGRKVVLSVSNWHPFATLCDTSKLKAASRTDDPCSLAIPPRLPLHLEFWVHARSIQ